MNHKKFAAKLKRLVASTKGWLKRWNYNSKVSGVSEIRTVQCEWCQNKTLHACIMFEKVDPKGPDFTRGFCNMGAMEVFHDRRFHLQSEWWVCGRCKHS